jgi:peptidoglycan/xylan/chitin deacetylase (PgdA/CDA1 family)
VTTSKSRASSRRASPWPRGARCAVSLTFDFDAETLWLARDRKTADLPGVMSQGRYGARVAVPRLLALLAAERVRATFYIPGWVVEHHPAEARAIRDAGHEIAHHGYLHDWARPEDPDGERAAFARGMKALETVLGIRPRGYRAPAWELTPITLDLVRQHGMIYSSNLMDDVYPYLHAGAPPVVELPVQWVLDDAPYFLMHPRLAPRPMQSPEIVFGIWRDEFRGLHELGGLFTLTCHPQVIGHPSRLLMLRRLIRLLKQARGVWWATAGEAADHWLARESRTAR